MLNSSPVTSASQHIVVAALLGCAIGDALGLPAEGLSSRVIARRFFDLSRFHLLGRTGFVSDDTEQTALVAEAIAVAHQGGSVDEDRAVRHFRRRLAGWFLRLPFGIGLATLRASIKILLGFQHSGVRSAGNGAAMRAAIVGVAFADDEATRRSLGRRLALITHDDERAVQGALFIAELAARLAGRGTLAPAVVSDVARQCLRDVVTETSLREALERALQLATDVDDARGAAALGTTGFVLHTVPLATFLLIRHSHDAMQAIRAAIVIGGDTDTNAAIVGAIAGAQQGASFETSLIDELHDGPFGPSHLRALGGALAARTAPPRWSALAALVRNVLLIPVIIVHGLRRLLPVASLRD